MKTVTYPDTAAALALYAQVSYDIFLQRREVSNAQAVAAIAVANSYFYNCWWTDISGLPEEEGGMNG